MKGLIVKGISLLVASLAVLVAVMSFSIAGNKQDALIVPPVDTIKISPPYLKYINSPKVDSILNTLTTEQKVAQLLMLPVYPMQNDAAFAKVGDTVSKYGVGGVIVFKGHPHRIADLVNKLQKSVKIPLLTSIDGEWGVSMRVDSTVEFPRQMMLGAVRNDFLIYKMGQEIARECKLLGININFAPVVDINTNPKNIIIGYRSFGEDKYKVAVKGFYYYRGMQDNGVLAVAKHFPGHGDTEKDSHKTLPVIRYGYDKMYDLHLYPFRYLINTGIGAVMVAHLHIPALDSTPNIASTLSPAVVKGVLYDSLGFEGVSFTDALNMKGVAAYWDPVTINKKAFLAGNTILLMPKDVGKTIKEIAKAVNSGEIRKTELDNRVRKVLALKEWLGLLNGKTPQTDTTDLNKKLVNDKVLALKEKLVSCAVTLLRNEDNFLPVRDLKDKKVAVVTISKDGKLPATFADYMNKYVLSDPISLKYGDKIPDLRKYDYVFVSLFASSRRPRHNYGIPTQVFDRINALKSKKIAFILFGSPYLLNKIRTKNFASVVVAYETDETVQKIVPQKIYGAYGFGGILPVSAGEYTAGTSITTKPVGRLKYGVPADANMNADTLALIDKIVEEGIEKGAYPGAQVLVARNGVVVYDKTFGYYTYDKKVKVTDTTLYDLASVTKLAATTLSLMKLYEQGKFSLDDKLSQYLPWLDTTNKKDITFREVLTHQAGLTPWIPFYLKPMKDKKLYDSIFSKVDTGRFLLQVADSMYMDTNYVKEMFKRIAESPMHKKEYKYSDIGFYLFKVIIERMTGEKFEAYVEENFYKPLGAYYTLFNPLRRFPKEMIAPTEKDTYFRNTTVQGYVHDFGAAMLGGVSGHAGLFSNANDLAKIMQMLLNGGEYGGVRYFKPQTIKKFTACEFCPDNRRGLGFDKPEKRKGKIGPTCDEAPEASYGHTGFTGTMVWNDPENGIVYIFLSNRVYPTMDNKKLLKLSIRTRIQSVIYHSFENSCKTR